MVEAASGALKASASASAMASDPGSYPRWEFTRSRCPRNSRRYGAGIWLPPCSQLMMNLSVAVTPRYQLNSGSSRKTCRVPSLQSWLSAVKYGSPVSNRRRNLTSRLSRS